MSDGLNHLIDVVEQIEARLAAQVSSSSCQVNTSTRGFDISCKAYNAALSEAVDEAVAEYWRAFDTMQAELIARGLAK